MHWPHKFNPDLYLVTRLITTQNKRSRVVRVDPTSLSMCILILGSMIGSRCCVETWWIPNWTRKSVRDKYASDGAISSSGDAWVCVSWQLDHHFHAWHYACLFMQDITLASPAAPRLATSFPSNHPRLHNKTQKSPGHICSCHRHSHLA